MKRIKIKLLLAFIAISTACAISACSYNETPTDGGIPQPISYFFTIYHNEWTYVEDGHWYRRLNVPAISKSVIDYGAVLVYYKNSENNWVLLPYSTTMYNPYSQIFSEEIWSGFALGTVDIDYVYTDPLNMTPRDYLDIRVVVIRAH